MARQVQCCTCSKWVHLRCLQLFLQKFRALGSSHSWSCHPCRSTVTPSSTPPRLVYLHCSIWPPLVRPTLAFNPLILLLLILYLLSLPPHHPLFLLAVLLRLLLPFHPDSLRILQWNAGGLRARSTELLHFLSSHSVDLICIQESSHN